MVMVPDVLNDLLHEMTTVQIQSQTANPFHDDFGRVVKCLRDVFQGLPELDLDLSDRNLGDCIVGVIGRALSEDTFRNLKHLRLGGNGLSKEAISLLGNAIRKGRLPCLESLCLGGDYRYKNAIGDDGLANLADAFSSGDMTALKVLDLSFNDIGSRGGTRLAESIVNDRFPALEVLDLTSNPSLGEELSEGSSDGLMTLVRALAWRTTRSPLKMLKLQECCPYQWWDKNIEEFAQACKSSNMHDLTHLYLPRHYVSESLLPLAKLLKDGHLRKLQVLKLWKVEWRGKCGKAFTNAVQCNPFLVFDIVTDNKQPIGAKFIQYKERNCKRMDQLLLLQGHGKEKATYGKIIFCGPEGQGKTTLRKTLQENGLNEGLKRMLKAESIPRTRGIDISYTVIEEKPGSSPAVTLALWDLAGHPEYEVQQSAFVTDLALAEGIATTFLLVCNAHYDDITSEPQMFYWMRRIAATSVKGGDRVNRHVILVLNRFKHRKCKQLHRWKTDLQSLARRFKECLNIDTNPFVLDAQFSRSLSEKVSRGTRKSVGSLKKHLIQDTRARLKDQTVPTICSFIKDIIADLVTENEFPCKSWREFTEMFILAELDDETLKAAANYLHESGHLIFFRGSEERSSSGEGPSSPGEASSGEDRGKRDSLIILKPDWFYKEVVGSLLLPQVPVERNETVRSHRPQLDGLMNRTDLEAHFKSLNLRANQVTIVEEMLLRLELCYKVGTDRVLVPTLIRIRGDMYPKGFWDGDADGLVRNEWVMGYCLCVEQRQTTLLPFAVIRVFRQLQAHLAEDPLYNGADTQYTAANHYITFKSNGLWVLVEISPDEQDRVDILVRPQVNRVDDQYGNRRKGLQMEMALTIVEKFVWLASRWCRGVEFLNEVFKPWSTTAQRKPMSERQEKMPAENLHDRIKKSGTAVDTQWSTDGKPVKAVDLLPQRDLDDMDCDTGEKLLVDFGLVPSSEVSTSPGSNDLQRHIELVLIRQDKLLDRIQALWRFSHEQIECNVPRFMYLTNPKDKSGRWMTARELLEPVRGLIVEKATLHFLCELEHSRRTLHEVPAQEGMEIANLKKWAAKISPWLNLSAKVAAVAGKVASQALLPGLGQLFDAIATGKAKNDPNIGTAVAYWVSGALIAGGDIHVRDGRGTTPGLGSLIGSGHVEVKEGMKEILNEVTKKMGQSQYNAKFRLRRFERIEGSEAGCVVWICNECAEKHLNDRAIRPLG